MQEPSAAKFLLVIMLVIGMVWTRSSFGKWQSGKFSEGLAQTLTKFASHNPYPWYKNFLEGVAIPNANVFATLTLWGETLTALVITFGSLYWLLRSSGNKLVSIILMLGLLGGMFLNTIFWLASGWMSPSTDSLYLLLFATELSGVVFLLSEFKNPS